MTEGQWSYINKIFFENDCRKRNNSLRSLFEAVLFLLVTGCQWRMLPHDYPKWQLVYYYFRKWFKEGRIEYLLNKLVRKVRTQRNQSGSPSVGALDAQSVKWASVRVTMDLMPTRKARALNVMWWLPSMALFLPGQYAAHRSMIPSRLNHCVMRLTKSGNCLKRFLLTRVTRVGLLKILKKILQSALRFPILQTGLRDSYRNLSDGGRENFLMA